MATDPDDIRLGDAQRRRLASLADQRGVRWTDVVSELLDSAEAILGIERALASAARGEGIPAEGVHQDIRGKFDLCGK